MFLSTMQRSPVRRRARALGALGLSLAGCHRCPSFSEMSVVDPDGLASGWELDQFTSALADFASATGREGVCVPEIQVVSKNDPLLEEHFDGMYLGEGEPIRVAAGSPISPGRLVRHELCHAIDAHEGLHDGRGEMFPESAVSQSGWYPTIDARESEEFARNCERRPEELAVEAAIDQGCGLAAEAARAGFLLSEVYRGATPPSPAAVPVRAARYDAPDRVDNAHIDALALWGDATLLVSAAGSEGTPELVIASLAPGDPDRTIPLPGAAPGEAHVWSVLAGTSEAVVIAAGSSTAAWRVDLDGGTAAALSGFPNVGGTLPVVGLVSEGSAWFGEPQGRAVLTRVDLASGESQVFRWEEEDPGHTAKVGGWVELEGRLVGMSEIYGILTLDPATGAWSADPSFGPGDRNGLAREGEDWLVTATTVHLYDFYASYADVLVLYDLATNAWAVPEEPCGAAGTAAPQLLSNGDAAWVRDHGATSDDYSRDELADLEIGP